MVVRVELLGGNTLQQVASDNICGSSEIKGRQFTRANIFALCQEQNKSGDIQKRIINFSSEAAIRGDSSEQFYANQANGDNVFLWQHYNSHNNKEAPSWSSLS